MFSLFRNDSSIEPARRPSLRSAVSGEELEAGATIAGGANVPKGASTGRLSDLLGIGSASQSRRETFAGQVNQGIDVTIVQLAGRLLVARTRPRQHVT